MQFKWRRRIGERSYTPSELLFNQVIKTKLHQAVMSRDKRKDAVVQERDKQAKAKMKQYADKRRRARKSVISTGDTTLLRQKKSSKFSTTFNPSPFKVICKKGTMITAVQNGKYVTRNTSLFKRVNLQSTHGEEEESDDDEDSYHDEYNWAGSHTENNRSQNSIGRYPQRNRRPVHRYGQNVHES